MVKKRGLNDTIMVEEGAVVDAQAAQDAPKTEEATELPQVEVDDPDYNSLLATAQEVRRRQDIVGYILKGDAKATVDLSDPGKIVEYAMLSSQAFDSAEAMSGTFQLGATENVLVEGKDLKMLCVDLGQNRISIFMQKATDHAELLKAFTPQLG